MNIKPLLLKNPAGVGGILSSMSVSPSDEALKIEYGSFSNIWELSVRRWQWPWEMFSSPWWSFDSVVVAVSIYNPSADAYGSVYGAAYRMQKPEGKWIVVEKGTKWMNGG